MWRRVCVEHAAVNASLSHGATDAGAPFWSGVGADEKSDSGDHQQFKFDPFLHVKNSESYS